MVDDSGVDDGLFGGVGGAFRGRMPPPGMFMSKCCDTITELSLFVEPRAGNASACSHQFERDYRAGVLKGLECRLCTSNRIEVQVLSVLHHAVDVPRM